MQKRIDSCPRGDPVFFALLSLQHFYRRNSERLMLVSSSREDECLRSRAVCLAESRCLIPTELIYGRVKFEMASDPSKGTLWLDHLQPLLKENERQGSSTAELGVARITSTEVVGRGQKLQISSQGWNWGQVSRVWWRPNNLELSYWGQNSGRQGLRKKEDVEEKAQTRMTVTGWMGLDRHSVWCLPRSWDKAFLTSVNLQRFIEPPFSLPSCSSWN